MMEQNFWEKEYKDFYPNVVFKFKRMRSLDVLDLAERNITPSSDGKQFKLDCLRNVVWSKNGTDWFDLMDEGGNTTLEGLPYSTLLDIFFKFRSEVCLPVFTESRAYQSLVAKSSATAEAGQAEKRE